MSLVTCRYLSLPKPLPIVAKVAYRSPSNFSFAKQLLREVDFNTPELD